MTVRTAVGLLISLTVVACTTTTVTQTKPSNNGNDAGTAGSTAPLNCLQIVDCIGACAASDQSCPDACAAKGSTDAQNAVVALASCLNINKCQDTTCVQSKCMTELQACVSQSQSSGTGGTPIDAAASPATGSVSADLVGTWSWITTYGGEQLDIKADGSAIGSIVIESTYPCHTKTAISKDGVATASGSQLTFYWNAGTDTSFTCDGPAKTTPTTPKRMDYTFALGTDSYNGKPTLTLTDSANTSIRYTKQ